MTVLVLGYSSLVRRRILPALARLGVDADVGSLTRQPSWPQGLSGRAFADYGEALAKSHAETVYVSTRNHDHVEWVATALDTGRHVIVDKPATLSVQQAEAVAAKATRASRLLAEATTWTWHPQVGRLRELIALEGPVTLASAIFSFPPLAEEDVRYRRDWGGGALWDLGPYAASCGRILFDAPPDYLAVQVCTQAGTEVETNFSMLVRYPGDRFLTGHFGFATEYVNRLDVLGPRLSLSLRRAFTTAPDQGYRIEGQIGGKSVVDEVAPADAFALFLADALQASRTGDLGRFRDTLLADARALEKLRAAALPRS